MPTVPRRRRISPSTGRRVFAAGQCVLFLLTQRSVTSPGCSTSRRSLQARLLIGALLVALLVALLLTGCRARPEPVSFVDLVNRPESVTVRIAMPLALCRPVALLLARRVGGAEPAPSRRDAWFCDPAQLAGGRLQLAGGDYEVLAQSLAPDFPALPAEALRQGEWTSRDWLGSRLVSAEGFPVDSSALVAAGCRLLIFARAPDSSPGVLQAYIVLPD